jgi:hypothetical protein
MDILWYADLCDNCGRRFDTHINGPRLCTPCLVDALDFLPEGEDHGRISIDEEEHDKMLQENQAATALASKIGRALHAFERGEITLMELYQRVKHAHEDYNE